MIVVTTLLLFFLFIQDISRESFGSYFSPLRQFQVTGDTKPVMELKNYGYDSAMKSYNQYVKHGSLVFNKITFYGEYVNTQFTRYNDWTHREYDESGNWGQERVLRSVGRIEFRLTQFDASVTWTSPKGQNRTCNIIGLSKCRDGLINSDDNINILRIFYDNAIILRPWPEVVQNAFKENNDFKTLQWKSYMEYCPDVSSQERRNVTAGIDHLFLKNKVNTVLVKQLSKQYRDAVLQKISDKIIPPSAKP